MALGKLLSFLDRSSWFALGWEWRVVWEREEGGRGFACDSSRGQRGGIGGEKQMCIVLGRDVRIIGR